MVTVKVWACETWTLEIGEVNATAMGNWAV
jgi:hypothetical protein